MPQFDINDYVQVKDRIKKFRADHPEYGLRSEVVVALCDEKKVTVHGWIEDRDHFILADGHAEEIRGSSPVNKTSPLENCETSAWGRALAAMGYEVDKSIASREEMDKTNRQQDSLGQTTPTAAQGESREEAAGTGTGAPAAPSGDAPKYLKVLALVKQQKTTDEELAKFRGWLEEKGIPNDFAKMSDAQLNDVLAEIDPL